MCETTGLLEKMNEMLQRMAAMQVKLDGLKAHKPPAPATPAPDTVNASPGTSTASTRRKMRRRLAGKAVDPEQAGLEPCVDSRVYIPGRQVTILDYFTLGYFTQSWQITY